MKENCGLVKQIKIFCGDEESATEEFNKWALQFNDPDEILNIDFVYIKSKDGPQLMFFVEYVQQYYYARKELDNVYGRRR